MESLHDAVEKGSLHVVKSLLKAGAYVDSVSSTKGYTPLCVAACRGDEEITKLLLSSGANVNVKMVDGETPLHIAVMEGHLRVAKCLLKNGADVDSKCSLGGANRSYTPLCRAIWQENERVVELLLRYGANVDAQLEDGVTVLQLAVGSEDPLIIDHILNYCPDLNNEGNKSALNMAVLEYGKEFSQIVENMLQYGFMIDPDVPNYYELLQAAFTKGYFKIVEELLKHGTDVNSRENEMEMTKLLINFVSEIHVIKDDAPIVHTSENDQISGIVFLLPDRDSEIPIAAVKNKREMIKLLINNGANVNARNQNGDTVLHAAIISEYVEVIEAILEYNVDVNSTSKNDVTPLHLSALYGIAVISKMLLSRGANVNAKQKDGRTALHIATCEGHKEVVELLLRCGAEVDSKTKQFMTPLHNAADNNSSKVVEVLLKFGANIDSLDEFGRTALHIAAKAGHRDIVVELLKHGCDINIESKKYHTALDSAMSGIRSFSNMQNERRYYPNIIIHRINACTIICTTLLLHFVKMKTANLYLSEKNLLPIDSINESNKKIIADMKNECEKEIANMKSGKIDNTNVSYYDILTKDINRLAMYAQNENIVRVFRSDDHKTKFPTYVNMIESNFRKGKIRKELLEQSNRYFHILLNNIPELPYNCTKEIFSYLSNEDLICAFGNAKGRTELLKQSHRLFYFLFNDSRELSYDCVEKIFSYLGDEDLEILIEAFKHTKIGSPKINDVTTTLNVPKTLQALPCTRKRKRE